MSKPLLLLPESGGAWLKACYDAEKDVMLMDEETQQKRAANFFRPMKVTWWSAAKVPMSGISACGARWSRLL
jgi:exonuclease V gamma subunit